MIKTITLNPSLDYIVDVDSFQEGMVNRSNHEEIFAGGKGINVSIVLKNLEIDNEALGYIAGFTGDEIAKRVSEFGVHCDFVKLHEGMSRINVKLRSSKESEINGQGPKIIDEDILHLDQKLDSLNDGDILVLAGSIPTSLPSDTYENIMSRLQDRGIKFIVDATKDLLLNVLKYKPFLIKQNHKQTLPPPLLSPQITASASHPSDWSSDVCSSDLGIGSGSGSGTGSGSGSASASMSF